MWLDLSKIIEVPGSETAFETSLDLSELQFGTCRPAKQPVRAEGTVKNTAGVLHLRGNLHAVLDAVCDRCAEPFTRQFDVPLDAVLTPELSKEENEDERIFVLEGNGIELDQIITTAFVLNMDSRLLCREDCKGLCCRCGANLNHGSCKCQREIDPRLAVLAQLLEGKNK